MRSEGVNIFRMKHDPYDQKMAGLKGHSCVCDKVRVGNNEIIKTSEKKCISTLSPPLSSGRLSTVPANDTSLSFTTFRLVLKLSDYLR